MNKNIVNKLAFPIIGGDGMGPPMAVEGLKHSQYRIQPVEGCTNQRKFLRVKRGCQASQKKGLTSGEVRAPPGKFGELPGKSGNFRGTPGLLLSSTVRELPGKSPRVRQSSPYP